MICPLRLNLMGSAGKVLIKNTFQIHSQLSIKVLAVSLRDHISSLPPHKLFSLSFSHSNVVQTSSRTKEAEKRSRSLTFALLLSFSHQDLLAILLILTLSPKRSSYTWVRVDKMARSTNSMFVGLSALFYLVLLFSPLALLQTANAESSQDPLQESYGTGKLFFSHLMISPFWNT